METRVRQIVSSKISENLEHKVYELNIGGTTSNTGVVLPVTRNIIEGDGIDQRAGRTIKLVSLHERLTLTLPALGGSSIVRVIYLLDTQNTGAGVPLVSDVLNTVQVNAHYEPNYLQSGRFKILSDRMHTLVVGGANQVLALERTTRCSSKVFYGAATAIAAADKKNSMHVLILTNSAANQPTYALDVGVRYTDA